MLTCTSTKWAPWYVVPADRKGFTRLATAAIVVQALTALNPRYPAADPAAAGEMARARADFMAERPAHAAG